MSKMLSQLRAHWQIVTILLLGVFLLWSLFLFSARLFVYPPGMGNHAVFIGEAKGYYFEQSSAEEKDIKFEGSAYKNLWLSLPNVSAVVLADEIPGADQDFDTSNPIQYITIDNQQIDRMSDKLTASEQQSYWQALNQVSAAAWEQVKSRLVVDAFVWVCLGAAFVYFYLLGSSAKE